MIGNKELSVIYDKVAALHRLAHRVTKKAFPVGCAVRWERGGRILTATVIGHENLALSEPKLHVRGVTGACYWVCAIGCERVSERAERREEINHER